MHIHITPQHLTLTAAIHSYVADKLAHLEDFSHRILAAHVVLLHDESKTRKHVVKVHLAMPGPDIHAEDAEDDLYAAIDKVAAKLARQLRKRKTKLKDQNKHRRQLDAESRKRGYRRI